MIREPVNSMDFVINFSSNLENDIIVVYNDNN
ncbi:hypothetical protein SAMN06295960_1774 [Paenibacillus aquistagni]|uniref:Uncharacterized protein n=1 Tax=Paenibacillus aquistagni TaxID=1852522 RepID=A0A1X7JN69_9BACL|nr:hypothetical protein SAMN06295960_1774 [Paenibacillus aquistagni]